MAIEPQREAKVIEGIVLRREVGTSGDVTAKLLLMQGAVINVRSRAGGRAMGPRALDWLQHLVLTVRPGRGARAWPEVAQANLQGRLSRIEDFDRYTLAALTCELALMIFPEVDDLEDASGDSAAFRLTASLLRACSVAPDPGQAALPMLWRLLSHAGFGRNAHSKAPHGSEARSMLHAMHAGATLKELVAWPIPQTQRRALWRELERHIATHLDKCESFQVLYTALDLERGARMEA